MTEYTLEEIEVKIKDAEEKLHRQVQKGAKRSLLQSLKEHLDYLKSLRENLIKKS